MISNVNVGTGTPLVMSWTHCCTIATLALVLTFQGSYGRKVCRTTACKTTASRILEYMDPSINPCNDFYGFACGNFLKTATIADDKTQNSSFVQVDNNLDEQLQTIVHEKPKRGEAQPIQSMKHLFKLCMDEDKIDARGVGHAVALLREAGGWPVLGHWRGEGWDWLQTEIRLRQLCIGGGSLFTLSVTEDARNTSRHVIEIDQANLPLPREYLVLGEDNAIVQEYYKHMVDTAVLYGADRQTAEEQLKKTLQFEIELAQINIPREERRQFDRMYNPYHLPDLMKEEHFMWVNWTRLLQSVMPPTVPLRENELIIVNEVDFFRRLKTLFNYHSPQVIANHMMWHSAGALTSFLTNAMRDRNLEYSKVLLGKIAREPRWRECLGVASSLSLALSSVYVKKFFDKTSKKGALGMTEQIRDEISKDFEEIDWMDDKTRQRAKLKASKIVQHIGYPEELINISKIEEHYKGLELDKEHYLEALLDLGKWANDYKFKQLREPVNKTDWRSYGHVAMVNAFYNPMANSMQFPAGILQQPFFSAKVPHYVNYAAIGFVIAHEITHGFDDQGSQFDSHGDLKEWWEEASKKKFKEKTKCIIDQYGGFVENQTQLNLNGINTQGENVADNGALKLSFRAYHRLAKQLGEAEPALPGLQHYTNDQLYLLSLANLWCSAYRPEALRFQVTTGVHSPAQFRINGPISNMPQFSEIFQCERGTPMNPERKCAVW